MSDAKYWAIKDQLTKIHWLVWLIFVLTMLNTIGVAVLCLTS